MASSTGIDVIDFEQTDPMDALLAESMEYSGMFIQNFDDESEQPTTAFNLSRLDNLTSGQPQARPSVALPCVAIATEVPIQFTYPREAVISMDPSPGQIFSTNSDFYGPANFVPYPINNDSEVGVDITNDGDVFEAPNFLYRALGHDALTTNRSYFLDHGIEKQTVAIISPSTVHGPSLSHSVQNIKSNTRHVFQAEGFDQAPRLMGPCTRVWTPFKLVGTVLMMIFVGV
jgi:hypothetical protein